MPMLSGASPLFCESRVSVDTTLTPKVARYWEVAMPYWVKIMKKD